MLGNIGLFFSGPIIIFTAKYAKSLPRSRFFRSQLKIIDELRRWSLELVAIFTYRWMNKNVLTDPNLYQPGQGKKKEKAKLSVVESFRYILKNPYLGLIAILVLSYGIAINLVEGVWKGQIKIAFPDMNDYNMFMGQFSTWTGAITILLMVVGNNVFRKLSWTKAAILTPIMVLGHFCCLLLLRMERAKSTPFAPLMGTTVVLVAVIVGQIQNVLSKGRNTPSSTRQNRWLTSHLTKKRKLKDKEL